MSSSELELDSAESVIWSFMEFRHAGLGISELVIVGGEFVSVSSVPRVDRGWSSVYSCLEQSSASRDSGLTGEVAWFVSGPVVNS